MNFNLFSEIMNTLGGIQGIKFPQIQKGLVTIHIVYQSTFCDEKLIHDHIVTPFLEAEGIREFEDSLKAVGAGRIMDLQTLPAVILSGNVLVIWQATVYSLDVKKGKLPPPIEVKTENTILGSYIALAEDNDSSLNMIWYRYPREQLKTEQFNIGTLTQTNVMMVYDAELVKPKLLQEVRNRLQSIQVDVLQAAGQLELLLNNERYSLFPTMMITERPDRVVLNLAQGKVVLLIQGTPFSVCLPAVFYDFIISMDELYQSFWISSSLLFMRYIAIILTITLPGLYVAIISFNPEITRIQLTLSMAGSRAAVPYPSYIEVLIMLFMIEALIEASLRLPKSIGSTATTVGGLILGQAAQQAGLVSSIMIIITSVVAVANFVIPINAMSFAMRIAKYPILMLSILFGIIGVAVGFFLLIAVLTRQRSFGEPFFKIFSGETRRGFPRREARL